MRFFNWLNEKYLNLFTKDQKEIYIDQVWDMLQKAYEYVGGLKGAGFSSKEEMIKSIPFWKLVKKNNKIIACQLYKDKNGRKIVAGASDGTKEGKNALKQVIFDDLTRARSYIEISDKLIYIIKKQLGNEFEKYLIPSSQVSQILNKDIQITGPYTYKRKIGSDEIEKVMLGTPGVKMY